MTQTISTDDFPIDDLPQIKNRLRDNQIKYGQCLSNLALYTKGELTPIINQLLTGSTVEKVRNLAKESFKNIEATFFEIDEVQMKLDDLIRYIDGSTLFVRFHEPFLDLLKDQTNQNNTMRKAVNSLKKELFDAYEEEDPQLAMDDLKNNLEDYLIDFSRMQDFVSESLPKFDKLFEEMENDIQTAKKYETSGFIKFQKKL